MHKSALDSHNPAIASVSPQTVMLQLERMLASDVFRNSSRLSRFLRYVVEHSLEGQVALKERQIGIEVFDRKDDYDPRADPVVRVEARQLRFKLVEYYAQTGVADEIVISLPKGGYAARFERRAAGMVESLGDGAGQAGVSSGKEFSSKARWRRTILLAAVAAGALILVLAYVSMGRATRRALQTRNPQARDLYLKGRYYWNKRTPDGLTQAIDYFTQAIVRDPGYAQAYVGLADCYNLLSEFSSTPPREAFARASAAARRAVELDDSLAEAHNALAFASFWGLWDVAAADREFRRALKLNPDYAQAHHWYATYLLALGRVAESRAQIERARELDPSSTPVLADMGLILFYASQEQEAIALLKQLEVTEPRFLSSHRYLRDIALVKKDYTTYAAEAQQTADLAHDSSALVIADAARKGLMEGGGQAMFESMLQVEKKLYVQGMIPAYSVAQTYALMGEKESASAYLTRALEKHESGMVALRSDFQLRSLHGDPSYDSLLRKTGLLALQ